MAVRDVLLDTNAYVAFKRGMPEAVEVLTHVPRIGMNSIVLGELLSGFAVGTREETNRQELQQFLASERVHQLVIDAETAVQYAVVYRELRRRGRPIPAVYLSPADKSHRLTRRLSQGQKGLEERALMAS